MSELAISHLSKRFGAVRALRDINLTVHDGEFLCLVGPTNAGKSTLLKIVSGIYRGDAGTIHLGQRNVTKLPPKDRRVSLMFQNYALFPTLTGYDNIAFPLKIMRVAQQDMDARVNAVADLLNIGHLLKRLPKTFSGGEQQRVAIARAIIAQCDLLMLDEPLTNLDARIRIALRMAFKQLHETNHQSVLYVTHDQVEAMSLSDRIAVLRDGELQQVGTPHEIYNHPVNRFVAEFIGSPPMNILRADLQFDGDVPRLHGSGFSLAGDPSLRRLAGLGAPRTIAFGVRPEDITVRMQQSAETPFTATVMWIEHLGSKNIVHARLGDAVLRIAVARHQRILANSTLWIGFQPKAHHILDERSGVFFNLSDAAPAPGRAPNPN